MFRELEESLIELEESLVEVWIKKLGRMNSYL